MSKIVGYFNVSEAKGMTALKRHSFGDAGEVDEEDRAAMDQAAENGTKIIFPFTDLTGARFWLISEADRSLTTILLAG